MLNILTPIARPSSLQYRNEGEYSLSQTSLSHDRAPLDSTSEVLSTQATHVNNMMCHQLIAFAKHAFTYLLLNRKRHTSTCNSHLF